MSYHPVTKEILDILTQSNAWHETIEHEAVQTSEEASKIRTGYTIDQGAKALICKIENLNKETSFVMFVLPGGARLDSKKIKELLKIKGFRFASEEELGSITNGVVRGGVPPFGNLFKIPVYTDNALLENEKIVFNAGDRRFSIAMKSTDYIKLVNPTIVSIIER